MRCKLFQAFESGEASAQARGEHKEDWPSGEIPLPACSQDQEQADHASPTAKKGPSHGLSSKKMTSSYLDIEIDVTSILNVNNVDFAPEAVAPDVCRCAEGWGGRLCSELREPSQVLSKESILTT